MRGDIDGGIGSVSVLVLVSGEELRVSQVEVVPGGACSALTVFAGAEEEEETKPGKVANCLLCWGTFLLGGVQGGEDVDGYGVDLGRWGSYFL